MKENETSHKVVKRKRAPCLSGITYKIKTGCGPLFVILNSDEEGLYELFGILGRAGSCLRTHIEAVTRLISLSCRTNAILLDYIVEELEGLQCPSPCHGEKGVVLSCIDGLAKVLKEYLKKSGQ